MSNHARITIVALVLAMAPNEATAGSSQISTREAKAIVARGMQKLYRTKGAFRVKLQGRGYFRTFEARRADRSQDPKVTIGSTFGGIDISKKSPDKGLRRLMVRHDSPVVSGDSSFSWRPIIKSRAKR